MRDHDPAALTVFHNRVAAVAEAMGATLQRAAHSPNIKERRDYSCAVFDHDGRLLAQAAHIPVHLGALPAAVASALESVDRWRPGDIVALNDPFLGGSHLPDITTVSAVFGGDPTPTAYVVTRAHHADVGGAAPGSLPIARDLHGEGLVLPPVVLATADGWNPALVAVICANSRTPDERRGDLEAQRAAHRSGERRLLELIAGQPQRFRASGADLLRYSEQLTRARLADLPPGTYTFTDLIDDDGTGNGPLPIRVTLRLADGRFDADFSGTAEQTAGPVNAPMAVTAAAVYYVVACLVGDVPVNAGTFAPAAVSAPVGSLVNPRRPAAVAAGNVETSQRLVDAILGALAQAAPDVVPAAAQGTMNNVTIGGFDSGRNRPFSYYETMGGGAGAGPSGPGASGLHVHMTNTRNTPIESLETEYPLRVEGYSIRRGTGGAGLHRGGDGAERRLRVLVPAWVTLLSERRTSAPWGLQGGGAGGPGENTLIAHEQCELLPAKVGFPCSPGDVVVIRSPGGGGWGRPPDG